VKGWCVAVVLAMFVGMMVPLPSSATTTWYYVQGTVFNSDTTVEPYATLELKNERTSDYLYTEADGFGEYLFDCADFENGWLYGDLLELKATSSNGQLHSYTLHHYLYADYDSITVDPMLPPLQLPTIQDVYICDLDESHRQESNNNWTWNNNPPYNYSGQNIAGVRILMGYLAHDKGDDAGWPAPPQPPLPDYQIHVNISFKLFVSKYEDNGSYEQDTKIVNYSLSRGELYNWDPYLVVYLKQTWNNVQLAISGWIQIEWTDWYNRLYVGAWHSESIIETFIW